MESIFKSIFKGWETSAAFCQSVRDWFRFVCSLAIFARFFFSQSCVVGDRVQPGNPSLCFYGG